MTDKELQKLNRKELLEMLIAQANEIERLQADLKAAEAKVHDRNIEINNAGSIAEAALSLNGVFEAAQAAAEQYLLNIRNAESICQKMQTDAELRAQQIVIDAEAKAATTEASAKNAANQYWEEVSHRLERFYEDHAGLRELLQVNNH